MQSVVQSSVAYLGQMVKSSLRHQRLGHPTNEIMSVMLKQSWLDNQHSMCTQCIKGNMSRVPFPSRIDRCSLPFEKVHADIWGPSPVKSLEGHIYYICNHC